MMNEFGWWSAMNNDELRMGNDYGVDTEVEGQWGGGGWFGK